MLWHFSTPLVFVSFVGSNCQSGCFVWTNADIYITKVTPLNQAQPPRILYRLCSILPHVYVRRNSSVRCADSTNETRVVAALYTPCAYVTRTISADSCSRAVLECHGEHGLGQTPSRQPTHSDRCTKGGRSFEQFHISFSSLRMCMSPAGALCLGTQARGDGRGVVLA